MKKVYAWSFLISLIIFISPINGETDVAFIEELSPSDSSKVWYDNWDEGMAAAKKEKKPVLVDFISDHCSACVSMDKHTFSAPEIRERLTADWVCIKVNTFHSQKSGTFDGKVMNYLKLSKYFRIVGVPTFIFFDKEGKPVQSLVGCKDKELFGHILDYMKDEAYKKGISFKEYRENKSSKDNSG
ncbi:thioredoxin family protein [Candidatus Latescibacterota bacterium]